MILKSICGFCGKEFEYKKIKGVKKYCSSECQNTAQSLRLIGDGNPNRKPQNNYEYECETCGKLFISYQKSARFCSRSCNGKRKDNVERLKILAPIIGKLPRKKRQPRPSHGRKNECKKCGVIFMSKEGKKTYCPVCTTDNRLDRKSSKYASCEYCGKIFKMPTNNKRKTCSDECRSLSSARRQAGENSHRWQGGKTSEAMIIRTSAKYSAWRMEVFKRDNYTCVLCGSYGNNLNADHIKPFSEYPELRLDVNNGRTLCFSCHTKTESFGVKGKRTKNKQEGIENGKSNIEHQQNA